MTVDPTGTEDPTCEVTTGGAPVSPSCTVNPTIGEPGEGTIVMATLAINTNPPGAEVILDGSPADCQNNELGVSPCVMSVAIGNHTFETILKNRRSFPEVFSINITEEGADHTVDLYPKVAGRMWYDHGDGTYHDDLIDSELDGLAALLNLPGSFLSVCMTSANEGETCPAIFAADPSGKAWVIFNGESEFEYKGKNFFTGKEFSTILEAVD